MSKERVELSRLHAYLDARLGAEEAARVAEALAADPPAAAMVADWRRQKALLHAGYDPFLADALPPALLARLAAPPRRPLRQLAAALAWLALGLTLGSFGGWRWGGDGDDDALRASLPQRAAIAHAVYAPEVRHPVEVGADQEAHLIAWLSKRLGTPLQAPSLLGEGFQLVGGRLIPADSGPGALLMYEDARGERLTLYICRDNGGGGGTAFRFAEDQGLGTFYWVDGPSAYALSGRLAKAQLLALASAVHRQLPGAHDSEQK